MVGETCGCVKSREKGDVPEGRYKFGRDHVARWRGHGGVKAREAEAKIVRLDHRADRRSLSGGGAYVGSVVGGDEECRVSATGTILGSALEGVEGSDLSTGVIDDLELLLPLNRSRHSNPRAAIFQRRNGNRDYSVKSGDFFGRTGNVTVAAGDR
jgi:hypothetical protein